ncbi:MAG TPA: rhodanese-like domain-containing protein [Chloroflexota bacterium]|nr:rhodanese-like domain-containing protein [Chloroflexota bacterium]
MLRMLFGGGTASPAGADLAPSEAHARAQRGALLVDVREPDEWRSGHAAGARHIPLGQLTRRLAELPEDRELIMVCRSGNRSGMAVGQLRRAGYTQVRNLRGGMVAWQRAGLPIER